MQRSTSLRKKQPLSEPAGKDIHQQALSLANMDLDKSPIILRQMPCVERVRLYSKGGFHPIHINDVLHNHYRIANKLGYGAYTTVWLVEDLHSGKYASLKVLTAESSEKNSEAAILHHLNQKRLSNGYSIGQEFLVEFLDDFEIEGPNGIHQCIVTEVLGPSLATVDESYDEGQLPIPIAKKFAAQLMRGIAYLHGCGVVHGGK